MDLLVYGHKEGGFVITADVLALNMLTVQTAACVLQACREYPIGDDVFPSTGIGGILNDRMSWAPHGYVNHLQSQAEFLYEVVKAKIAGYGSMLLLSESAQRKIVADALKSYQEWKTKVVEDGYRRNGERWGSGTAFNQMDWSDLNEKLLVPHPVID